MAVKPSHVPGCHVNLLSDDCALPLPAAAVIETGKTKTTNEAKSSSLVVLPLPTGLCHTELTRPAG